VELLGQWSADDLRVHAGCTLTDWENSHANILYQSHEARIMGATIDADCQRWRTMAGQGLCFWWCGALGEQEIDRGRTQGMEIDLAFGCL
jgi:hypothetical protein